MMDDLNDGTIQLNDDGTVSCVLLKDMAEFERAVSKAWSLCLAVDPDDERRPRIVGCKLHGGNLVVGVDVLGRRLTGC